MTQINYYMPTRVLMGDNCIAENRGLLKELGMKALIVTGKTSAKVNGSEAAIVKALEDNGQRYVLYDKVMSNPTVACVFEAADRAKQEGCDFVIAAGGGSPMDAAKAAAGLVLHGVRESEIFSATFSRALPVVAVPTTAGTGSEVTPYAILTNDAAQTKTSVGSPALFPRFAFLDPQYMRDLNKEITINTAIDALSHSIEGMLTLRSSVVTDALAIQSIALIVECFDSIKEEKPDPHIRKKLLWGSTLGGMVIANTGTTAVHAMGYALTFFKHIDHGRANGLLLARFLELLESKGCERISAVKSALHIRTLREFTNTLNILLGKREHFTPGELEDYAERAAKAKNIGNGIIKLEKEDLLTILEQSLG